MSRVIDHKNTEYWNILKGIGALAIVLGHSCYFLVEYVYLFHLALFFFVSGYLYSEEKYGDVPFLCLASRLKSMWPRYVVYFSVIALLHNTFLDTGIILNESRYSLKDVVVQICSSFVFTGRELMACAMWFAPALVVASAFFAGIVWFGRRISAFFPHPKAAKLTAISLVSVLIGMFGVILNRMEISLVHNMHTSFLVIPIYAAAWFLRISCQDLNKYLKWYLALPAALGLYYVCRLGWRIELSAKIIPGPISFYLVSFTGIYLCMYIGKVLQRIPYIKAYFVLMGRYSFEIMAFHFIAIKLVDLAYAAYLGETDKSVYGVFVCAYPEACWLLYAIAGTVLPLLSGIFWTSIVKRLNVAAQKAAV